MGSSLAAVVEELVREAEMEGTTLGWGADLVTASGDDVVQYFNLLSTEQGQLAQTVEELKSDARMRHHELGVALQVVVSLIARFASGE